MQNPRVHTGKGYRKCPRLDHGGQVIPYVGKMAIAPVGILKNSRRFGSVTRSSTSDDDYDSQVDKDQCIDEEEEYRNKLLEYEQEEEKLTQKKMRALKALKVIDDEWANDAAVMQSKVNTQTDQVFAKLTCSKSALPCCSLF